jgi:hypothetical protein
VIYNGKTKRFEITVENLDMAYLAIRYALRNVRQIADLPMDRYDKGRHEALTPADHAQRGILDIAKMIGIDMGAEWGDQIDLRGDE